MNDINAEATEWKREKIRALLSQCTEPQINLFNRMYKSIDLIPDSKMARAYDQCYRTVEANKKKANTMSKTIVEFFDPYNVSHLKAYRHHEKTGFWPEGFVSDEMMKNCPLLWQAELTAKLARAWLQAAEDGHIFGMPHFDQ